MKDVFSVDQPSIDQLIQWLKQQRAKHKDASLKVLLGKHVLDESNLIDLACVDLMQTRRQGRDAKVEDYIEQFPTLKQESLRLDLIDAEICVRRELKQPLDEEEFIRRFPDSAESISQLLRLPEPEAHSTNDLSWGPPKKAKPKKATVEDEPIPDRLGGYRVLRLLGHGAMGAVYEARQISLDRLVALKTIRNRILHHPAMLARFTREAYSAAQLTHHNVVQIYDFGEDRGRYFFSMERVDGGTLADVVRKKGTLDPRLAAGYALQAARGLQFAHRHGMVHRDIKPANLLLTSEGVVKVADLGLVKLPGQAGEIGQAAGPFETANLALEMESGTDVTIQGTAVGTPAYMAPEQSLDAAAVDHRADLYSLGCTLFYMLSGLPPFRGSAAAEVIDQHAHAIPPDLRKLNPRVPATLQRIVQRAMAKRPRDRYATATEMIQDLEMYLGVAGEGGFSPSAEQADQWESISTAFAKAAPQQAFIRWAFPILVLACVLTLIATLWFAPTWWPLAPSMMLAAIASSLLLDRRRDGHPASISIRRWFFSLSWMDWGIGVLATIVVLGLIFVLDGGWGLLVGTIFGAGLGVAFQLRVQRPARKSESASAEKAEKFIRQLRLRGADEDGVERLVARYSGRHWQRLFERLFGYRSLVSMRDRLRLDPNLPPSATATSFCDLFCAKLDARAETNQLRRDQKRLFKVERRALKSQGVGSQDADAQAWQIAAGVIQDARVTPRDAVAVDVAVRAKRERMKAMLADARSGRHHKPKDRLAGVKFALSGQTRLAAGLVLMVAFVTWASQAGVLEPFQKLDTLEDLAAGRMDLGEVSNAFQSSAANAEPTDGVPEPRLLGANPWSVGIAGILLMMSAFVSGWRMTPPALIATLVILYGTTFGIPEIAGLQSWMVAAMAGVVVYLPGIIWGESTEE